jgi:hypothetical protein
VLPAPRIAPISYAVNGEQNLVFLSEYCSRDREWGFISLKVVKGRGFFKSFIVDIARRN